MVRLTEEQLRDGDDPSLLTFMSSDSEADMEDYEKKAKFAQIEAEVPLTNQFPHVVMVAGLPKVGKEKLDKLKTVLTTRVTRELITKGVLTAPEEGASKDGEEMFGIELLMDEKSGLSAGVALLTFKDSFEATNAVKALSSVGLDVKHPFRVCKVDGFDTLVSQSDEYEPPRKIGFIRDGFRDWLSDELGREQYLYRYGQTSEIMWHDAIGKVPERANPDGTEKLGTSMCWSPMGTYLLTFHKQGIWLRAGDDFDKKVSFSHESVKYISFSPNEEYLITWDGTNAKAGQKIGNSKAVRVWQVLTGKLLREFPTPEYTPEGKLTDSGSWPHYLWSHDGKYLAMRGEKDLVVFESPSMFELEEVRGVDAANPTEIDVAPRKRSHLKYPLERFEWSPASNVLSIWIPEPENGDAPGRLLLIDIPSRQEITSKNVFNVKEVSLHWQWKGEFLALRTLIARKKGKKTKKETTQIEVFRVKDRSVPVDNIILEEARFKGMFWELGPVANRMAILLEDEVANNHQIRFCQAPSKGSKRDTEMVESMVVPHIINHVEWSPTGQYFLAVNRGADGTLIFACCNEQNKVEILQRDEHMNITDVMWDPSGRYVCTAVLVPSVGAGWKFGADAGFRIYSFQGQLTYKFQDEKCYQFLWRPRPPSPLSPEKIEEVHKKLKDYSKRYDSHDEIRRLARKEALHKDTSEKMEAFMAKVNEALEWKKAHPCYQDWEDAWARFDAQMDWEVKETVWEEQLEVIREGGKAMK